MFILLEVIWVILNGRVSLEIILIGLVVSAGIYAFMCKFMDFSFEKDKRIMKKGKLYIEYFIVLGREVVISNIQTIHFLTTSKLDLEPTVITFEVDLKSTLSKALLANSITLTPGTITTDLDGQIFTVHALDIDFIEGIENCEFIRLLEKIEQV